MLEQTHYLSERQQKQFEVVCDKLGLNNRNIAYILNISNWYVGEILSKQKMSIRMHDLFSTLIPFLVLTANENKQLTFRYLTSETLGEYRKRKKKQLKELKNSFMLYTKKL